MNEHIAEDAATARQLSGEIGCRALKIYDRLVLAVSRAADLLRWRWLGEKPLAPTVRA